MLRGNTLGWLFPFPLGPCFGCGEDLRGSSGTAGGSGLCTPGTKAEPSEGKFPFPLPRRVHRGLGSIPFPTPVLLSGGAVEELEDNIPHNEISQTTGCGERFDADISRKLEGFVAKSFQHSMDHLRPRLNGVGRRFVHWQCRSNTLG